MKDLAQHAYNLLNIQLTSPQLSALERYERELIAWNERMNLTAIREPGQIRIKHFLDSFTCSQVMREAAGERVIDVGSGAGFPGIPLKIIHPALNMTLVESVGKKAEFCRHIVKSLEMENVQVIQERVEILGQASAHRQKYDWAIARAVAIMPVLAEYLLPLVRVGGSILAMKGESAPAEVHEAEHAIRLLGGHLRKLIPVSLPGVVEEHYLVVVDKVAATPDGYPRRVGIPAKKPLLSKN
ncbi:MAG: 16S rRNA (guanine(527)-N(7))-methyltransferase RsmG [Anaerolineales bacterium]|nr:16S rRNA (guanine(527)-N(7))-methyltransferase RsmG [Anaerolineales bacterium]